MRLVLSVLTTGALGASLLAMTGPTVSAAPDRHGDRSELPGVLIQRDAEGHPVSLLPMRGTSLAPASELSPGKSALAFVRSQSDVYRMSPADLASLRVGDTITDPDGMTYVTLEQRQHGLRVDRAPLQFTFDPRGRLVYAAGGYESALDASTTGVGAVDAPGAVRRALAAVGSNAVARPELRKRQDDVLYFRSAGQGGAARHTAEKVISPSEDGRDQVAWRTYVEDDRGSGSLVVVDASSGAVLSEQSTVADSSAHGTVFGWENPDESGPREVIDFSGINGSWVTNNITVGNNVDAYEDRNADNLPDPDSRAATSPSGDPNHQHFDFEFSDDWKDDGVVGDDDFTVTQMFYYTNVMHNFLYSIGFTEQWRNFQVDNFGRGGNGNDEVLAEARDGYGTGTEKLCFFNGPIFCRNNANFGTPPDGLSPRMQMYLWDINGRHDSALDGDVIAHEYGHGLSNRLVGGGNLGGTHEAGSLGEGWSDTVSFMHWQDAVIGEYSGGQAGGIRSAPYNSSALTYASYAGNVGVHGNGEIWAATLYQLMTRLQLRYGSVPGLLVFRDAVVDGMKNTAGPATYPGARDGVIAALRALNDSRGIDDCLAWHVFASRGLGINATAGGGENVEQPASCSDVAPNAVLATPAATPEGTSVQLDARASSLGSLDPSASLAYDWDLDNDGEYDDATGPTPQFDKVGQDGNFPVGVRVSSPNGQSDTASATVTVTNVQPALTTSLPDTGDEGAQVALTVGGSDPGWQDALQATVNWGDGTPTQVIGATVENTKPDATLSGTATHHFGDNGTYSVHVCLKDDDSSVCTTESIVVANVSPTVTLEPFGTANEGATLLVKGTFTDPGWLDTERLDLTTGGAGQVKFLNLQTLNGGPGHPDKGTFEASVPNGDDGSFTVTATVTDDDAGVGSASGILNVFNVAPSVTATLWGGDTEGEQAVLMLTGTDPGWMDSLSATVDWGDGAGPEPVSGTKENLAPDASITAQAAYHYGDNGDHTITTCVADDTVSTCESKDLSVANVAPVLTLEPLAPLAEGEQTTLAASFADPGWLDTHSATIDRGDGAGPVSRPISRIEGGPGTPDTGSFTLPVRYGRDGSYTVTAKVTDDDGAVHTVTATATVGNVAPAVDAGLTGAGPEGSLVTLQAQVLDAGWLDPLTATVDWGDGSDVEPLIGSEEHLPPDATINAAVTHRFGDNGSYPVEICAADDDTSTCVTKNWLVGNVAPQVTIEPLQAIDEGGSVLVEAHFADPGWVDTHAATVDLGDGQGPKPAVLVKQEGGPGTSDTGTLQFLAPYGDNGDFTVTVTVTDDDGASTAEHGTITVRNVAPEIDLDTSATRQIRTGVRAILTDVDTPVGFSSEASDPGSDDLTIEWSWGDGAPNPDKTVTHLVNPPFPDPVASPSVQPRQVASSASHAFPVGCTYTVENIATDDDGLTDRVSVVVAVLDDREIARTKAKWLGEYNTPGKRTLVPSDQTDAELACYLATVRLFSERFSTAKPVNTLSDAATLLKSSLNARRELDATLLAGWLNIADGSINPGFGVNTDAAPGVDTAWIDLLRQGEQLVADPAATNTQLKNLTQRLDGVMSKDSSGEGTLLPW